MSSVMRLVGSELSEPYVIYTYRYFLTGWYVPPIILCIRTHTPTIYACDIMCTSAQSQAASLFYRKAVNTSSSWTLLLTRPPTMVHVMCVGYSE